MKCTEIIIIGFTSGSYKCKWVKGTFLIFQLGGREGGEKSKSSESHWWFQEQLSLNFYLFNWQRPKNLTDYIKQKIFTTYLQSDF